MKHEGRIWFGDDDVEAADATLEVTADNRIVVSVGDTLAAEWELVDVDVIGDHPVSEFHVGDEVINFEPIDREAMRDDMTAARMRVRLQQSAGQQPVVDTGTGIVPAAAPVEVGGSYCRACGLPIDPRAEICPNCGVRQFALSTRPQKSRTTAGLLALFLGGFGAHHFYLGHTGLGILYLLFFWTFIPAMVAFIEALVFFFSSDTSFDAKYNS